MISVTVTASAGGTLSDMPAFCETRPTAAPEDDHPIAISQDMRANTVPIDPYFCVVGGHHPREDDREDGHACPRRTGPWPKARGKQSPPVRPGQPIRNHIVNHQKPVNENRPRSPARNRVAPTAPTSAKCPSGTDQPTVTPSHISLRGDVLASRGNAFEDSHVQALESPQPRRFPARIRKTPKPAQLRRQIGWPKSR